MSKILLVSLLVLFVVSFLDFSAAAAYCGNGIVEAGEQCDGGGCCTHKCRFRTSDWICRKAKSNCDADEYCTGSSDICPTDVYIARQTVCRLASGPCDRTEYCSGTGPTCPDDGVQGTNFLCNSKPSQPCLTEAYCDGVSKTCPTATKVKNGTMCRGPEGPCDAPEYCDGSSALCPKDKFWTTNVTCGISVWGGYNLTCDGQGAACPADTKKKATTPTPTGLCGNGVLDTGEQCEVNMTGNVCCTSNCTFATNATSCRPSTGRCDIIEYCTGTNATCPSDTWYPNGTLCRPAGVKAPCDLPEYCDGVNKTCPADLVAANGTVCRAAFFGCDLAEVCNGVAKTCPVDKVRPSSFICRTANNATYPCWSQANCDGFNAFCPPVSNVACP
eukprot:TRINITY_DN41_c0_g1_i1.p1 TRINITY_DN41_c0_g1~~TRINITY_DN41_c0_g1_i1.p1  ORF type:complete len:387 (-),score=108.53 TRINITY_DN41_c0_g1_i1:86-1246(-)